MRLVMPFGGQKEDYHGKHKFAVVLSPGGIIAWLFVGLIAGWLAGLMMKGSGYGVIGDIVVGLIGSFFGGLLLSFFVEGAAGFWQASSSLSSGPAF